VDQVERGRVRHVPVRHAKRRNLDRSVHEDAVATVEGDVGPGVRTVRHANPLGPHPLGAERVEHDPSRLVVSHDTDVRRLGTGSFGRHRDVERVSAGEVETERRVAVNHVVAGPQDPDQYSTLNM
jgi:hypothetical protein